jgi:hypothetical protein
MSVFDRIDHYIADVRRARQRARTERMIRALPSEVQKDIGWPEAYEESRWRIARLNGTHG